MNYNILIILIHRAEAIIEVLAIDGMPDNITEHIHSQLMAYVLLLQHNFLMKVVER